jgi:hypothetical protein
MIVRIDHPDVSGNEKTYLSAAVTAAGTTLTVQNIEGFAVSEYVIIGKLGEEKTEIVQLHASTAPTGSTITLVTGGVTFAHPINTPVTYIGFNQVAIVSATSKTGTYAACSGSPKSIEADQAFTEFDDSAGGTTTWYKVRYYNSSSAVYSAYSDPVKGTGYTEDSLRKIIDKANAICNDRDNKILTESEKIDFVNDGYKQVINRIEKADHKRFLKQAYVDIKKSYNTGTVSVDIASTAVTGVGTTWDTGWTDKQIIFNGEGYPYTISSVNSATTLTLTEAYHEEANLSGETYKIFQKEYTIYDASDSTAVDDLKKIEQVVDEDGTIVNEYDPHRTETGYYLKREGDNLKLCLNYVPATSGSEGKWAVWYLYQPAILDTMADEPEFPQGYSSILVSYLSSKIWERIGDMEKASYYLGEFNSGHNKMMKEITPRTNERKGFRIDRNLRASNEHDSDWSDDIYSRKTIGT